MKINKINNSNYVERKSNISNNSVYKGKNEIAKKHNLTLVGEIDDIRVERITQNKERDLTFLKTLAEQYGYIFKITDNQLVFYNSFLYTTLITYCYPTHTCRKNITINNIINIIQINFSITNIT